MRWIRGQFRRPFFTNYIEQLARHGYRITPQVVATLVVRAAAQHRPGGRKLFTTGWAVATIKMSFIVLAKNVFHCLRTRAVDTAFREQGMWFS